MEDDGGDAILVFSYSQMHLVYVYAKMWSSAASVKAQIWIHINFQIRHTLLSPS